MRFRIVLGDLCMLGPMTSSDRPSRGRPVSERSRAAAVAAATALLDERGWSGFSVDEVARRSGVGKATVYRHWPDGFALAVEAWGALVDEVVPTLPGEDVLAALRDQMVRLGRFYRSPHGRTAAELIAGGVLREAGAALVNERFFGNRRRATLDLLRSAVVRGELRDDLDPDLMIDLLFGPIVFRLVNGMPMLADEEVAHLARVALPALRPQA